MKTYHPVVGTLKALLDKNAIRYTFFEHEAVRTSEEASHVRKEFSLEQGAKALILNVAMSNTTKQFIMAVLPAHKRLDGKKLCEHIRGKKVRFATQDEASILTNGVEFGGVPPFGNLFQLPVYVDPTLFDNETIIFNCGDRSASIAMQSADYARLVPHMICPLT